MSLTKQTITDKIESVRVQDHWVIQVRESTRVLENNEVISENFHRYVLNPDADVSTISDPLVLAQFNLFVNDIIKENYQKYLEAKELSYP